MKALCDSNPFNYKVTTASHDEAAKANGATLATIEGYATYKNKENRNKRFYPDDFWERQLDNDRVREMRDTRTFFGEPKHPGQNDSPFVELPNVSHSIRDYKFDDEGVFVTIDILNTPSGRGIKTLVDYGSKIGISTRAYGEQKENDAGQLVPVDDNYFFVTWDLVTVPAFGEARLTQVSDTFGIDVDYSPEDFIGVSRERIISDAAGMNPADAKVLCDFAGISLPSVEVDTSADLRLQLDEAVSRILSLEAKTISVSAKDSSEDAEDKVSLVLDRVASLRENAWDTFTKDQILASKASQMHFDTQNLLKEDMADLQDKLQALQSKSLSDEETSEDLQTRLDDAVEYTSVLEDLIDDMLEDYENSLRELEDKSAEISELIKSREAAVDTLNKQLSLTESQLADTSMVRRDTKQQASASTDAPTHDQPLIDQDASVTIIPGTAQNNEDGGLSSLFNSLAAR